MRCNNFKGIRRRIFLWASNGGFHTNEDKGESIRYEDRALKIRLAFRNLESAQRFYGKLMELNMIQEGTVTAEPIAHYNNDLLLENLVSFGQFRADDTGSPEQSVSTPSTTSTVSALPVDEASGLYAHQRLQCEVFCHGGGFETCYIKDKAYCVDGESEDPNNTLALTPSFHTMFAGRGGNNYRSVPSVRLSVVNIAGTAIQYDKQTGGSEWRTRVVLLAEFHTLDAFLGFGEGFKDSSEMVDGDRTTWKTQVDVLDANRFKEYVEFKYENTAKLWAAFEV